MEYELRMAEKNKAIGFNIAQNGIFVFLWWVEFALVWKASRPTKRAAESSGKFKVTAQQSVQADTRHALDGEVVSDEVIPF